MFKKGEIECTITDKSPTQGILDGDPHNLRGIRLQWRIPGSLCSELQVSLLFVFGYLFSSDITATRSVCVKSSPLYNKGKFLLFASAYENRSPKFNFAGCLPFP